MFDSRKWRAVLTLAALYGVSIALKFVLVLRKTDPTLLASFDETIKWAMGGMSLATSTYIFGTSMEDYAAKRGPTATVQPQQTTVVENQTKASE